MRARHFIGLIILPGLGCSANPAACTGVGTYRAKGTPPCCGGLHLLPAAYAGYANGAQTSRVCWPANGDIAAFSCTQGTCGDGQCEGPEALPCGCALDCPRAAWGPSTDAAPSRDGEGVDAGSCSGLGNYPHGEDFGTPPCCPGLNRQEMRVPILIHENHACVQDDVMSFACTQGTCGDGRCEPPEGVPCVCPPDCPSAVWESSTGQFPADARAPDSPQR